MSLNDPDPFILSFWTILTPGTLCCSQPCLTPNVWFICSLWLLCSVGHSVASPLEMGRGMVHLDLGGVRIQRNRCLRPCCDYGRALYFITKSLDKIVHGLLRATWVQAKGAAMGELWCTRQVCLMWAHYFTSSTSLSFNILLQDFLLKRRIHISLNYEVLHTLRSCPV